MSLRVRLFTTVEQYIGDSGALVRRAVRRSRRQMMHSRDLEFLLLFYFFFVLFFLGGAVAQSISRSLGLGLCFCGVWCCAVLKACRHNLQFVTNSSPKLSQSVPRVTLLMRRKPGRPSKRRPRALSNVERLKL